MLKNKLFPAQEDSENILKVLRRHWLTYAIFWFIAFIMLIPLVFIIIYWINNSITISYDMTTVIFLGSTIYSLFIIGLIIYGFIDFYLDVYIITDERIVDIKQNGFFNRAISELNLNQIQDVNAEVKGIAATLLHYGNVYIQTAGEKSNFVFENIPHPYEVSKNIIDLHEEYLEKIEKGNMKISQLDSSNIPMPINKINSKAILNGINNTLKQQSDQSKTNTSKVLKEGESVDL